MIVTQDGDFQTVTQQYCERTRDQYGLTMPMMMDPDQLMKAFRHGGNTNAMYIVVGADGTILKNGRYPALNTLENWIRVELGLPPL